MDNKALIKEIEEVVYNAVVNEKFQYNDYQLIVDDLLTLFKKYKGEAVKQVLEEGEVKIEYLPLEEE